MKKIIVTIDGPCASGKSSVARKLAKKLGFIHLNSGALYRIVGVRAFEQGIPFDAEEQILNLARSLNFSFVLDSDNNTELLVNGKLAGAEIIAEQAGKFASTVGLLPKLREMLTNVQREAAKEISVVLEGRDAGTVVFPNADFKFFIDASIEERTKRRLLELKCHHGPEKEVLTSDQVQRELEERDYRDSTRNVAPTLKAKDAVLIDTTELAIDEVVDLLANKIFANC